MGKPSSIISRAGCASRATTISNVREIINLLWADGHLTDAAQTTIQKTIDIIEKNEYLHLNAESWLAASKRAADVKIVTHIDRGS